MQMENRIEHEIEEKEGLLQDIERTADLKLEPLKHHKEVLVSVRNYGLRYPDSDSFLFENLDFEIRQGERVFLNGENGCGKSSLIKTILTRAANKEIIPQAFDIIENGEMQTASGMNISYINQDTAFLKGSIKDFCVYRNLDESFFCALLHQMGMERAQFVKPMEDYSEGQKKKILIEASLLTPAHLYIWDEPLNYIDVFSRMQIEKIFETFEPTMLIVEHDVRFREEIATKIINI